jgi:hypothetical protein
MVMRILDHGNDADARLVAILMKKMGVTSLVVTNEDDAAMLHDIEGCCLVAAVRPERDGTIELKIVRDEDLPDADEVIN